jgi:indolepyruvate ferredoxin oxidoreductase beta subunit
MTTNIMFVGVGGQGTLLASKILGNVLIEEGYDVKVSEVHGMSQRGGSVVTYVKFGKEVYSPIVDLGDADIIVSFEQLEALRYLSYLKKDGHIIVNTQKIDPMPVITGAAAYPDGIIDALKDAGANVVAIDALSIATQCGSSKAVNIVLVGVMAKKMGLHPDLFLAAIERLVKPQFIEMNKKAFTLGYDFAD